MEGSAAAKSKLVDSGDPKINFAAAGLPAKSAVAWLKGGLRVTGNFKRDAAVAARFWRQGADFLAKLPKKPQRTTAAATAALAIQSACRNSRERFLTQSRRNGLSQADQQSDKFRACRRSYATTPPNSFPG